MRVEVRQQSSLKADEKTKENEEFDVPFDLIMAEGFGTGFSARAAA